MKGLVGGFRRTEPTEELPLHLGNVALLPRRQLSQEFWPATIAFVEREPLEADAVANGAIVKLQRDLPLRPIRHRVRNAGLPTALAVGSPTFRQKQLAI